MDKDIDRVAENISNLYSLFKHMNEIIYDQGKIVDRIDYNVDQALIHVKKGTREVKSVQYCVKY